MEDPKRFARRILWIITILFVMILAYGTYYTLVIDKERVENKK